VSPLEPPSDDDVDPLDDDPDEDGGGAESDVELVRVTVDVPLFADAVSRGRTRV